MARSPLSQTIKKLERVTTEDAVGLVEHGSLDVAFVGLPEPGSLPTRVITVEQLGVPGGGPRVPPAIRRVRRLVPRALRTSARRFMRW
jgi:hypothetical protein